MTATALTFHARTLRMRFRATACALASVLVTGCDLGLDLTNPNAPTAKTALSSIEGVIATSLGMQDQFTSSFLTYVRAPALITDEWGTASRALAADQSLFTGDGIDASFGVVSGPYYATYRVARTANEIIAAVPGLTDLGPGFAAGLTANAKLFKAMALGLAAMHYERLPLDAVPTGGTPAPRADVFAEVIRLLESARTDITGFSAAELSGFTTRAVSPGFSVQSTIDAMLARYYLYTGQYAAARDAAARVSATVVSLFTYPNPDLNPIYNYSVLAVYVAPLRNWARAAEPGDRRVGFWVDTLGTPPLGNPPTLQLVPFRMYGARNDPIPAYLPGEMLLIRAEAEARLGNLAAAVALINQVRQKSGTSTTPGAQLPAVSATTLDTLDEVLAQIAYERSYELFSQGVRWEDLRRLGQYIGVVPKATFLPMPQSECNNNPSAGC